MLVCPGYPKCTKRYPYPAALKAHVVNCPESMARFDRQREKHQKPVKCKTSAQKEIAGDQLVGSLSIIARRPGGQVEIRGEVEYPTVQREYTNYWMLGDIPSLQQVYTPRRDHVKVLLSSRPN